jgi:hypothetical protein
MGDPTAPDEPEDVERLLSQEDDSHGPGDLDSLPPSDFEEATDDGNDQL